MMVYSVIVDVLCTFAFVYLFVSPLRVLFSNPVAKEESGVAHSTDARKIEVELLPLKCMVVSSSAVLSTLLSMVMTNSATSWDLWINLDAVVNMCCLLIMTRYWNFVYWRLCAPLLTCLSTCCMTFDESYQEKVSFMIEYYKAGISQSTHFTHSSP